MAASIVLVLVLSIFLSSCNGDVLFSSLSRTLKVTASPRSGQTLKAGADQITVKWALNSTLKTGTQDSAYETVKLKLCYAPISQKDRPWRRTEDHVAKDKTCQHAIATKPYRPTNNTFTWRVERDVPTGTYFVRAYVYGAAANNKEIGYGQTTDPKKQENLFMVEGITGRHATLDIVSAVFSAFSVVSLFWFFYMEKRKAKKNSTTS